MRPDIFSTWSLFSVAGWAFSLPESPSSPSYKVFEELSTVPEGWKELPSMHVDLDKTLEMRIHLAQQNVAAFEQRVMEISTPDHPTYGDHMETKEIKGMLQPSQSTLATVLSWLKHAGLQDVVVEHDWIKMNVTIGQAEQLLNTKYSYFRDEDEKKTILRTLSYSLPIELHEHILLVQPTTMFGMRPMRSFIRKVAQLPQVTGAYVPSVNLTLCNSTIIPGCLKALYNFDDYVVKAPKGRNVLGVNGFLEEYAQYEDLRIFLKTYAVDAIGGNFTIVSVNGGLAPQNVRDISNIIEANLDTQYTVSLSYPTENIYFSTAGRPPYIPDLDAPENNNEPYLDWLNWILAQKNIPQTITTSYGESEQTVPLSYRKSVCNLFAQLGARGTSVIFSSGDSGAGWSCLSNDGKNTTKFQPVFPASCPWVTGVGGTHHVDPEQAIYYSSGGFSETWPAPSYQRAAISTYFRQNPGAWGPWGKYFNSYGRGIPDVAAQADNYRVIINGQSYLVGGTSASAPTFAAVVSLLNDQRIASGKKPLGFLNPWLYSKGVSRTFNDITDGRSTGCTGTRWRNVIEGYPRIVEGAGWDAVPGWDPVTGLGTPNFEEMRELL